LNYQIRLQAGTLAISDKLFFEIVFKLMPSPSVYTAFCIAAAARQI
jgi:hypothetical protein